MTLRDYTEQDLLELSKVEQWTNGARCLMSVQSVKCSEEKYNQENGDFRISVGLEIRDPKTNEPVKGPGFVFISYGINYRNLGFSESHSPTKWTKESWEKFCCTYLADKGFTCQYKSNDERYEQLKMRTTAAKKFIETEGIELLNLQIVGTLKGIGAFPSIEKTTLNLKDQKAVGKLTPIDKLVEEVTTIDTE